MTNNNHAPDSPGRQVAIAIQDTLNSAITADRDQIFEIPFQSLNITDLAISIVAFVDSLGYNPSQCISAINLAAELHSPDIRFGEKGGEQPYIVHPLRNTLRLIRWGASNESLLMAAVLHDTVEDHPFELAAIAKVQTQNEYEARDASFKYLSAVYGQETTSIVSGMSNPILPEEKKATTSREEWNSIYAQHIQTAIVDPMVFVCKVSDFVDNTTGLSSNGSMPLSRRQRMAKKYLPVCGMLLQRLNKGIEEHNLPISDKGVEQVRYLLESAHKELGTVVNSAL